MRIREATAAELPLLQGIERAAGQCFRNVGMPEIADDEPLSVAELARFRDTGRAWVAVDASDAPLAYLIAEPVDGCLHIEQVSVHPAAGRRGVGRALIEYVSELGFPALTLTTFADVAWNAPYYARFGFVVLAEDDLTPGLRRIRAQETAHGLDRWPRVCMKQVCVKRVT
jgi:GNAT superfamily N-acetyltransferase